MAELGLFAKYWQPGKVKTRLGRAIGQAAAADVYRLMLDVLLYELRAVAQLNTVVYAPREQRLAFEDLAGDHWRLEPQMDGDLGQRMSHFVENVMARNEDQRVVLVGSDTPELRRGQVRQALDLLDDYPVVLGPTHDGGYYLIAMRQHQPVFEHIPWSTSAVFEATLERLDQFDIPWCQLPMRHDIDTVFDLGHWIARMQCESFQESAFVRNRLMEILKRHEVDVEAAERREMECDS